jgi:hypothetical protein
MSKTVPAELKRKYSGQEVPQWEIDAWNASNSPAPAPVVEAKAKVEAQPVKESVKK